MSNDEFRASQAERRAAGLKARHETRLARAQERARPIWLMDVDGVLNAFDDSGPVIGDWGDWEVFTASGFPIRYSPTMTAFRMTPELPIPEDELIPEEAIAEIAARMFDGDLSRQPQLVQERVWRDARFALAAALPHLRSLQVETQVRIGRALGWKEAAEEIAVRLEAVRDQIGDGEQRELAHDMASIARYVASQPQNATSEPRTDLPVGPSHPKDSEAAAEARAPRCTSAHPMARHIRCSKPSGHAGDHVSPHDRNWRPGETGASDA